MENLRLHKIQLKNFRNLGNQIIEFSPNINCIFGENGNGKTNILEAIYYLANKKSFRKNTNFPQILDTDSEKPEIYINSSLLDEEDESIAYALRLTQNGFEYFKNSKLVKRKPKLPIIFINPFDSFQFHMQSQFRRSFFDHYFGLLDDDYRASLAKYNRTLRQRNALLANYESRVPSDNFKYQIEAIDELMVKYIVQLSTLRCEIVDSFNKYLPEIYKNLFSSDHTLTLQIKQSLTTRDSDELHEILSSKLSVDLARRHTTLGPHRDDYITFFDGFNAFEYCSLGQQKMSFLSLLFAYIDLFRYKKGSYPVVLIDDVSGELDQKRWNSLISFIESRSFQVLITTANESFRNKLEALDAVNKFRVCSGQVTLDQ